MLSYDRDGAASSEPSRRGVLSEAGSSARAHDPDRFLTALFAPAERRESLFVLIAFNHELVRALEMPSLRSGTGPIAALIRLQWWREVVEGAPRRHEIAGPLAAQLSTGAFDRQTVLSVIEAREAEAQGIETWQDWQATQLGGPGGMQVAFAEALGERDPDMLDRMRWIGAAYGAGSILRHHRSMLQAGRCPFPDELLRRSGSSQDALLAGDPLVDPGVLAAVREAGREWLAQAGRPRLGRARIAAALPAVLAHRDLERPSGASGSARGLGDRLALTAAWLRGAP
jgi:phytoene synthase